MIFEHCQSEITTQNFERFCVLEHGHEGKHKTYINKGVTIVEWEVGDDLETIVESEDLTDGTEEIKEIEEIRSALSVEERTEGRRGVEETVCDSSGRQRRIRHGL